MSQPRPPSKSKMGKVVEMPRYPTAAATSNQSRRRDTKGMQFTAETNDRLNDLYRRYIQSRKHNNDAEEPDEPQSAQRHQIEQPSKFSQIDPVRTLQSAEQRSKQIGKTVTNEFTISEPRSEHFHDNRSASIQAYRQSSIKQSSHSQSYAQVQLERLKTRLQRSLFQSLSFHEDHISSTFTHIQQKTMKLELKLSRTLSLISKVCHSIDQMRYRTSQNVVLRELNRELELKVKSLEQQRKAAKEEKDLQAMKQAVNRMKHSNNTRQERAATPGRDRIIQTQKKLLIKQNLQLKKERDALAKQFQALQILHDKLTNTYEQLATYCKELQNKSPQTQNEEMYLQLIEHTQKLERKYADLQKQSEQKQNIIDELSEKISKMSKQPTQTSQISQLKHLLNNTQEDLEEMTTRYNDSKKQQTNLKKLFDKKQLNQRLLSRQVDALKEENQKLSQEILNFNKIKPTVKKIQSAESTSALKQQLLQNEKLIFELRAANQSEESKRKHLEQTVERLKSQLGSKQLKKTEITRIVNIINNILEGQTPSLRDIPTELASILARLSKEMKKLSQSLLQAELENKKLNMYKNKLDHILHEDDRVEHNEFQTSQVDAFFFRQKVKTDANLNEELKKVAAKLDNEYEENVKNKAWLIKLRKEIEELQTGKKLARDALMVVLDESKDRREREEQLTVLLAVLEMPEEKEKFRRRLFLS